MSGQSLKLRLTRRGLADQVPAGAPQQEPILPAPTGRRGTRRECRFRLCGTLQPAVVKAKGFASQSADAMLAGG